METTNQTIAERLKEVYKFAIVHNLATDKQSFSQIIGISASTLSRYLSGKKIPSNQTLLRINEACGGVFNSDWLVSGNGNMLTGDVTEIHAPNTGHIRDGNDNVQNVTGNNNQIGMPQKKFQHESEWFALVAEKDKQIDRLLAIVESFTKSSN